MPRSRTSPLLARARELLLSTRGQAFVRALGAIGLVLLAISAIAYGRTTAGALATLGFVALAGAGVAIAWPSLRGGLEWLRPDWVRAALASLPVVLVAHWVFWDAIFEKKLRYVTNDWGIHLALVRELAISLDRGRGVPSWLMNVSTGDSPFELYPLATYWITAQVARILGSVDDIPTALTLVGVVAFVMVGVGVARLGARLGPWPAAALAGVTVVLDRGDLFSGGAVSTLAFGVIHQAVALALVLPAYSAIVDWLRSARLVHAIRIWAWLALGAIAHPSALLVIGALVVAIAVAALLTRDVPAPRLAAAGLHVIVAVSLSAFVWMPYAARVMEYGAHYGNPGEPAGVWLARFLSALVPVSSYPVILGAGIVGAAVAFVRRRAAETIVAATAAALLLGYLDLPWLLTDLAPSPASARFAAYRVTALAKPFLVACVVLVPSLVRPVRERAVALASRSSLAHRASAGAVVAILLALSMRAVLPVLDVAKRDLVKHLEEKLPDQEGFDQLVAWAAEQARTVTPGRYARLYYDDEHHYIFHLAARTGMPVTHPGPIPCLFLRERIDNQTAESLRRFDVRWVASRDGPPPIGDPSTQRRFGTYYVRELPDWDGKLARIEHGTGEAVVTSLENERVVVDLRGTSEPALVAFGFGYYPRWRARHGGREIPVYGIQATPNSQSRVVAAWLPPGRTVLTPDAPLPSDHRGLGWTAIAVLIAIGFAVAHERTSIREQAASLVTAVATGARRHAVAIASLSIFVAGIAAVANGSHLSRRAARAVTISSGFVPDAWVEARPRKEGGTPEKWKPCEWQVLSSRFDCGELGYVVGSVGSPIREQYHSWGFVTPAISVFPTKAAEFRIVAKRRLRGSYFAAAEGRQSRVDLLIDGLPELRLSPRQAPVDVDDAQRHRRIVFRVAAGADQRVNMTLTRRDRLDVDRAADVPQPPAAAPREVRRR